MGPVHVLCNNAGVLVNGTLADSTDDEWRWLLGVNVHGVMNGVRAFVPRYTAPWWPLPSAADSRIRFRVSALSASRRRA